jgi:predicted phage baseplate assembly protein
MNLPVPNLDDRAFQDFVDEAKRALQRLSPTWTDNNVADPGITLIETFAYMTDQLVYRLNQVPELHYIKFLELLGENLRPPAAAHTTLRFMLAVPQRTNIQIPKGTAVSTVRTGSTSQVTFSTDLALNLVSLDLEHCMTQPAGGAFVEIDSSREFECFSENPEVGDALYLGLNEAATNCIIELDIDTHIEGIGVDPLQPPWAFDAWNGDAWEEAELLLDTTGGLNRKGKVQLLLNQHQESSFGSITSSWIRIRVTETVDNQPAYSQSPAIKSIKVNAIGGEAPASHRQVVTNETLGRTTGTPGETFQLKRFPVISGQESLTIEISSPDGWEQWHRVDDFSNLSKDDCVFALDSVSGKIRFGPMVRQPDGTTQAYGATPAPGSVARVPEYSAGGGTHGNLEVGELRLLRTSIPFIASVKNIAPAVGGIEAESIDDLKSRAAIGIRARNRAVSTRDFEYLVKQASPSLIRTKCLNGADLGQPGTVLVLVVPEVPAGRVPFQLLRPRTQILNEVREFLDERRLVGTTIRVEPPRYMGVAVAARLALETGFKKEDVFHDADLALATFMHPLYGGYDGKGWPFGRDISVGDIYGVLQHVKGLSYIDLARLIPTDAVSQVKAEPADKIALKQYDLLYSMPSQFEVL